MHAYRLHQVKGPLQGEELETPQPAAGEVLVQLRAAALNRRDFWITQGLYPGLQVPVVLGSDGAGLVDAVGAGVDAALVGREVIINPGLQWGESQRAQSSDFEILGMPRDGTFASHVVVPASHVYDRPSHLSWQEAAALPLAGVTAYRAVFTQAELQAGETMLVSGIGGGVATFALQYGVAAKANVVVTSSSAAKLEQAMALGASRGYDYRQEDWHQHCVKEVGPIDVIIDGAGGDGYARLVDITAPAGRIISYGSTAGPAKSLDLFKLFWKQLRLCGSTMGSPQDFQQMVDFVTKIALRPTMDRVFTLTEVNVALERMRVSEQFGKVVLDIGS